MTAFASRLLLVDDTPNSLELLSLAVASMGWACDTAVDGERALAMIKAQKPGYYSVVISDWKMPKMNGLELLQALKKDPNFRHIPFVLQTALTDKQSMQQGISAGAFYYLTKPLDLELVESVIQSALQDFRSHQALRDDLSEITQSFSAVSQAEFHYKTIDQAHGLATLIASLTAQPQDTVVGLFELMVNAVEHGNLGITYDEKSQLIEQEALIDEVNKRLQQPENIDKFVKLNLTSDQDQIEVIIRDMGEGFNFEDYLEFSMERALDTHGRGIMIANNSGFNLLEFSDGGRQVTCQITRH